ncbi:hypothetical protein J5N97_030107 [Dioscorea zingiberensis]|uniref:HMA domain-containing protein n=1 Tax=Dioscorea zingiberensis TaxID=325984 RepID=A0A9D5BX63_9LILI|nr:hypothetical protein J5N97_030107 [Dioscorea zingiberensis]
MASLLFKEMKGVSFSCASPASTAICTSLDHRSMVRSGSSGRAIDRHSPHLQRDYYRRSKSVAVAGHDQLYVSKPTSKPPYNYEQQKSRIMSSTTTHSHDHHQKKKKKQTSLQIISPPGSSRYLLDDNKAAFIDHVFPEDSEPHPPMSLMPLKRSAALLRPSSSTRQQDQVVVLRVSLHCKGCEGKVRRHISKMEGVTSFSIDLAAKKVTVIGDVTPLGVLNSVSKVKNAQFWPSGSSSPPRASASF